MIASNGALVQYTEYTECTTGSERSGGGWSSGGRPPPNACMLMLLIESKLLQLGEGAIERGVPLETLKGGSRSTEGKSESLTSVTFCHLCDACV